MNELERALERGELKVRTFWSDEQTERLPAAALARRRRRAVRRMTGAAGVLLGLALAVPTGLRFLEPDNGLVVVSPAQHSAPQHSARATPPEPSNEPRLSERTVSFGDGSQAILLNDHSAMRTRRGSSGTVAQLLGGSALFTVRRDPSRVFAVDAGDVRVEVIGTRFTVQRLPFGAQVQVHKGRVRVRWHGRSRSLKAGQEGVFPPEWSASAAREGGNQQADRRRAGDWRELARSGEYRKAYGELQRKSGAPPRDEPADLLLAADVARLSGHPAQALRPLRRLIARFPEDHRAALAAFTLGRVLMDGLERPGEAAASFAKARALWPEGPLAEDALAREIEAHADAGNTAQARRAAKRYLERYPSGRHARTARSVRR